MKAIRGQALPLVLVVIGFLISGCGGSGTANAAADSSSGTQIFATDDLNTGYDHVWVTIDKVDLVNATGAATTVFDDTPTGGRVVDLLALHDATGAKFLLLGGCNTPAGTYAGANVTVASALTVVVKGAEKGTAATFSNATAATVVLPLTFPAPQTVSSSNKVVIDFDVANWTLSGATVSSADNHFLAVGAPTGIADSSRQCPGDYDGTITALAGTSPTQSFTLTHGKFSITVDTTDLTTLEYIDGSSNPALSNGESVNVTGTFDGSNNMLSASAITIRPATVKAVPARVRGLVQAFDPIANTIGVQVEDCDGFQPDAATLTVSVGSGTTYADGSGVTDTHDQFFAGLTANKSTIVAVGTLKGETLTATMVGLSGAGGDAKPRDVAVKGATANANAASGTFDLTLTNWEGQRLSTGAVLHVVTSSTTKFSAVGATQTQPGFFALLTPTSVVQVRGALDIASMTLTATQVSSGTDDRFHF